MKKITIIYPIYKDTGKLLETINNLYTQLNSKYILKIILSLNGSDEKTINFLTEFANKKKNIKLIINKKRGKGRCFKSAIKISEKCDLFVLLDCDDSIEPFEIERKINQFKTNIAFGIRNTEVINRGIKRKLISKFMNYMTRLIIRTKLKDHYCGFKLIKYELAKKIFNDLIILSLAYDADVAYYCKKRNIYIQELRIQWRRSSTKSTIPIIDIFVVIKDLFKIRFTR